MKFKLIDGKGSFVYQAQEGETVESLYRAAEEKMKKGVFLFRGTPRALVERSEKPIMEVLPDSECLYIENSAKVQGPTESVEGFLDPALVFSVFVAPSDNSCLFHSLSEVLSARSSSELRRMVADAILGDPKKFAPYIEKDPFSYSKWITEPSSWGGETELVVISKIYDTKICVISKDLKVFEFGEDCRSAVYLMYTGAHYNAVVAKDKQGGVARKFARGNTKVLEQAKAAVKEFFENAQQGVS